MSKRVVIILGVGLLLIIGAFFLFKYENTVKDEPKPVKRNPVLIPGETVKAEPEPEPEIIKAAEDEQHN